MFCLGLGLTSGALAPLHTYVTDHPSAELGVLVLANLAATVLRFLLLRHWVFRGGRIGNQEI